MLLASVLVPNPSVVLGKRKLRDIRLSSEHTALQAHPNSDSFTRPSAFSDESSSDGESSSGDANTSECSNVDVSGDEEVHNDLPKSHSRASTSSLVKNPRPRKHACSFTGCTKSYTKPSRLAEHERSHSGLVRRSSHLSHSCVLTVTCTKSDHSPVMSVKSLTCARPTFMHI